MNGFSIVLCTYNGRPKLTPTLDHLAALSIPQGYALELIVVDNASTDGTTAFVQAHWAELGAPFPLQLLEEKRPGKGYAVELGYDAAQYTYILTVDDDNWLSADYLIKAVELFHQHPDVGILQGKSIAEFETPPPEWVKGLEVFFVIGSPVKQTGYFPTYDFGVWGAGMVILNEDWKRLRALGFAFLTSKRKGKAAGEDHETAIGILMLGRRIYYSDQLTYKHFMPKERISWETLKKGFGIWGFLTHYNLLYSLVIDAYGKEYVITKANVSKKATRYMFKSLFRHSFKQHIAYWLMPKEELYQLSIYRDLSFCKWYFKLLKNALNDTRHLQSWMIPLLQKEECNFKMPAFE